MPVNAAKVTTHYVSPVQKKQTTSKILGVVTEKLEYLGSE